MKPSVPINTRNQSNNFIAAHTAQVNNHCNSPVSRVGQSGAHQKSNSPCKSLAPQPSAPRRTSEPFPNTQIQLGTTLHKLRPQKQPNPREQEHPQNPPSNHLSTHQHNPSTYTVDFPSRTQNLASRRNLANLTITHIAQQANPHKEVPKKVNKCKQHTVWFVHPKAPTSPKPYTVHLMHYTLRKACTQNLGNRHNLANQTTTPGVQQSNLTTYPKGKQIQAVCRVIRAPHSTRTPNNGPRNPQGSRAHTKTITHARTPRYNTNSHKYTNAAIMPASTSNPCPTNYPKAINHKIKYTNNHIHNPKFAQHRSTQ
eukprot:gene2727-1712_t